MSSFTPLRSLAPFDVPACEQPLIETVNDLAATFATTAASYDESAEIPIDNLRALSNAGLDSAFLPVRFGGGGASPITFGNALATISKACPATACVWLMHVGAAVSLISMGNADSAEFFRGELAAGKRFANALSEPTSGNLFLMPLQVADPAPGGWTLSGAKRFVSGCEIADYFFINAVVDGQPGFFGVDRDSSLSFIPIWDTLGLRASRSQLISLDGTLLRTDRRCGPPQDDTPNPIGTGLAWLSIGVAEAALDALVDHACNRVIPSTGLPLSHMQWVQFEVAEATVALNGAKLLAGRSMWLAEQGSPDTLAAALEAKLCANQVAQDIAQLGVKIGGASGFLRTSPIQRHFRDAQAGALMAYSVELCRDAVGKAALAVTADHE
ncbi:MAG: acyl-CoA dehydrogenase family protein, partial [Ilumatobacteraceae bacterium]